MSTKPEDLQAIRDAASRGDSKTVRDLLNQGIAVDAAAESNTGNLLECTALYSAMAKGKLEFIEELLMRSADPNVGAEGTYYTFPIIYAAREHRSDVVKLLLQHKADPNKGTSKGYTAAHYAIIGKNPGLFRILLEAKADCDKRYWRTKGYGLGYGPSVKDHLLKECTTPGDAIYREIFRQHQESERRQAEASAQAGSESSSAAASSPKAEKPGSL